MSDRIVQSAQLRSFLEIVNTIICSLNKVEELISFLLLNTWTGHSPFLQGKISFLTDYIAYHRIKRDPTMVYNRLVLLIICQLHNDGNVRYKKDIMLINFQNIFRIKLDIKT